MTDTVLNSAAPPPSGPADRPAPRRRRLRFALRSLVLVVLVVVLSGSALVGTTAVQGRRPPGGDGRYVALGSSFAAAPGVGGRADRSPWLCLRSDANYPRQVAGALGLGLTDVTCSGATTAHLLRGGQFFQPAQVAAVRSSTTLVTVTAGGNDVNLLGTLMSQACASGTVETPVAWRVAGVCDPQEFAGDDAFAAVERDLRAVVTAVRARAPRARVVVLDYQSILPEAGTCPDVLPLSEEQVDAGRAAEQKLNATIRAAATGSGATFVSAHDASVGHDICSADPWITGYAFPANPLTYGPLPFHPNAGGVAATSRAVVAALA